MMSFFGAEKEKSRLVNASRGLYDCVYMFVSCTNTLFRMFNQFLKTEFPIIIVRETLSIKENLQLLMSSLRELQELVDSKDKEIKEKIGHTLYSKITKTTSSSADDKLKLLREISVQYKGVYDNICGPVSIILLKQGNLLEKLEAAIRDSSGTPVLSLRVSDLLMTYEEITKVLPDVSSSTSSVLLPTDSRARSMSIGTATFSLTSFVRILAVRGQSSSKNTIEMTTDCLEDTVNILKPVCESFQKTLKMVEEYVTLIIDKLQ
ncbi:uncharacterized protein LOC103278867 [Anolis carolinensis]|uniref:uncharacterized protein LOC103278867 n=1 Tax=Anolis carolinensis TaxID=28377 RepID=UPI00046289D9|nr:PREDICTED: uncharacterized protein LOC103278867 [Anolis carolinensis]XP_016849215.1 PREDICTED: uncharacterized protein LOC103278867 [Anolis carolinensis]|eukprot:XP_008108992.1 PREDICTED: uncharacterized protein LOC103278867 [Anolis carolinensis]